MASTEELIDHLYQLVKCVVELEKSEKLWEIQRNKDGQNLAIHIENSRIVSASASITNIKSVSEELFEILKTYDSYKNYVYDSQVNLITLNSKSDERKQYDEQHISTKKDISLKNVEINQILILLDKSRAKIEELEVARDILSHKSQVDNCENDDLKRQLELMQEYLSALCVL